MLKQLRGPCAFLAILALGVVLGACLYDSNQRCGPAMLYVEAAKSCVCESNAIAAIGGCQRCAADEVASGGKCVCPAGQTKGADHVCAVVTGLGDPCDTATAPCSDATYSYCAVAEAGTAGTCTKTCASNTDCDAVYTCATWEATPYCRTFEGVGTSCASPADCVDDAKYCDAVQTHMCIVSGCSLTANDCPRGTQCCDFSSFGIGTLCAGACL